MKSKSDNAHIRLYRDMLDSDAFKTLPGGAAKLFLDLRVLATSFNNGAFMVTLSVLERRGWNSTQKLIRALDELLDRRILKRTKYCAPNVRHEASRYGFTDLAIHANATLGIAGSQPTHDYLTWTPREKSDFPKRESYGSRNGKATVPETGKHPPITVPETGKRGNRASALNANENPPFFAATASFPETGKELCSINHTYSETQLSADIESDTRRPDSVVVSDSVLQNGRSKNKRGELNEFDRARRCYERNRARRARASSSP